MKEKLPGRKEEGLGPGTEMGYRGGGKAHSEEQTSAKIEKPFLVIKKKKTPPAKIYGLSNLKKGGRAYEL